MSSGHQQITGNINSFNRIINFIAEIDVEGRQIMQWLSLLDHRNATKACGPTDSIAWETGC